MEFCHSFGAGISLAAIETSEENEAIKDWLEDNGKGRIKKNVKLGLSAEVRAYQPTNNILERHKNFTEFDNSVHIFPGIVGEPQS